MRKLSSKFDRLRRFHFWELAEANDAKQQSHILSVNELNASGSSFTPLLPYVVAQVMTRRDALVSILQGIQCIAKFNRTDRERVYFYLANIRIHRVSSDILITFHLPESHLQAEEAQAQFYSLLKSIAIHDWNLFGE